METPPTTERQLTQQERIMAFLMEHPNEWYLVSDFQRSGSPAPFIGYEAGTELCKLLKKHLIASRWSSRTTQAGRPLKEYSYVVEEPAYQPTTADSIITQQSSLGFDALDF